MSTTTTRTWELRHVGARPLVMNKARNLHYQEWAQYTRETRRLYWALARQQRIPKLRRVAITVTPLHANAKSVQDPAACAPEAKAAIDGLVDAGVIPDDGGDYVAAVTFLPPLICGDDGMAVLIEEVA